MAGHPIARAGAAVLEECGEDWVLTQIAEGSSIRNLCNSLEISTKAFYKWKKAEPHREEAVREMRAIAAELKADEAEAIADGVSADRDQVSRAKLQIDTKVWRAGTLDPAYRKGGSGPEVNVRLNVQELHLNAVRGARERLGRGEVSVRDLEALDEASEGGQEG